MHFTWRVTLLIPLVVLCDSLSREFRNHKAVYKASESGDAYTDGPGSPLYLTPYISRGDIDEGTQLIILVPHRNILGGPP